MSDDTFERFSLAVSDAVSEAARNGLSTSDTAQALIVAAATLVAVDSPEPTEADLDDFAASCRRLAARTVATLKAQP